MSLVLVPCGLCGGSRFRSVHRATGADPGSDAAAYFSSSRASAGHLEIVRCEDCGLVMSNPRDDDATLARTYAALEDPVYDAEDDNRVLTAREHLAFVQRHCARPGSLLDLGCSTGTFVRVAAAAGWKATGLDASSWSIERARERCPEAVFVRALVEEADFPAAGFDAVTLWDALEHLPNPAAVLARAREWLVPDGFLFINVPNVDSLTARALGRRWMLLLREHLWYFSPTTLSELLQRCGFLCVETRPNFVRFSVASVLGRLAQYTGPVGRFGRLLGAAPIPGRLALRFAIGRAVVNQAAGMVSVQAGMSVEDALLLVRAYSFAENRPITDVAAEVVDRRLRLPDARGK